MAWQGNINQLRDTTQREDWEGAWDAAESMFSELIQAEGISIGRAFSVVTVVANSAVDTPETDRVLRNLAGCGPEHWGAVTRRMGNKSQSTSRGPS